MKTLTISQDFWDLLKNGFQVLEIVATLATWLEERQQLYNQNNNKDARD